MSGLKRKRRDELVDLIRTVGWFRTVGNHLGTHKPREIQRAVALATTRRGVAGDLIKNGKFMEYSRGTHVPRAAVVDQVELMVPRSRRELEHPLWLVLRADEPVRKQISTWLRQLDPEIQRIVISPINQLSASTSRHTLGALERRASMDSLAALTMLLRLGYEEGNSEWVWLYAHAIFRTLLMMWPYFQRRTIAAGVFQLYAERIFCLAVFQGKRMALERYDYQLRGELLALFAEDVKGDYQSTRVRKMPTFYALQVLDGKIGPRAQSAFLVPIKNQE